MEILVSLQCYIFAQRCLLATATDRNLHPIHPVAALLVPSKPSFRKLLKRFIPEQSEVPRFETSEQDPLFFVSFRDR